MALLTLYVKTRRVMPPHITKLNFEKALCRHSTRSGLLGDTSLYF